MSAAPLKQHRCGLAARPPQSIRAHMSAAPLKQYASEPALARWINHPRSHERGPVEAQMLTAVSRIHARSIRAHMSAAPLKRIAAGDEDRRHPAIRAHMSAAPLKPPKLARLNRQPLKDHPRSHERGPVEANLPLAITASKTPHPRSHERGPVEATVTGPPMWSA